MGIVALNTDLRAKVWRLRARKAAAVFLESRAGLRTSFPRSVTHGVRATARQVLEASP